LERAYILLNSPRNRFPNTSASN